MGSLMSPVGFRVSIPHTNHFQLPQLMGYCHSTNWRRASCSTKLKIFHGNPSKKHQHKTFIIFQKNLQLLLYFFAAKSSVPTGSPKQPVHPRRSRKLPAILGEILKGRNLPATFLPREIWGWPIFWGKNPIEGLRNIEGKHTYIKVRNIKVLKRRNIEN